VEKLTLKQTRLRASAVLWSAARAYSWDLLFLSCMPKGEKDEKRFQRMCAARQGVRTAHKFCVALDRVQRELAR
jgi:hypothetical protein